MSELESAQQIAKDAVELVDMFPLYGDKVNFLLDQLKKIAKQPQLTIPKSIANKLDKVSFHNPISQLTKESGDLTDFDSDVKDYAWKNKNNGYICVAYLAGKALGVDLVKVVEG